MTFVCYCKGQPCNPNRYKCLFSLAYAYVYPFLLMCKTLIFGSNCASALGRLCKKTLWYDHVADILQIIYIYSTELIIPISIRVNI